MGIKENLVALPQYVLPQHLLSGWMGKLTHSENRLIKDIFIKQVIRLYGVDMAEAVEPQPEHYASFNQFFTRALRPGARPLAAGKGAVVSPADGVVSQAGAITDGEIFQAKGKRFSATALLGGCEERAAPFSDGVFSTIYLSPKDYHRLHMPLTGTLREMVHIPGRLFSVNAATTHAVPSLFARNERVAAIFDTEAGPMALVLVGAIFVSSIETVWHGVVTPPTIRSVRSWRYQDDAPILNIGEEMGRFNMGSTIVVLFGKDQVQWLPGFAAGQAVKMGGQIGRCAG